MTKKLALNEVLSNLDKKNLKYYDNLSEEQQKEFQPFVLLRFMSSSDNSALEAKYSLISVNEFANQYLWELPKEKELHAKLLAASGLGFKQNHSWIAAKSKTTDIVKDFIKSVAKMNGQHPNKLELDIHMKNLTYDILVDLLDEYGIQKDEAKKITTQYKKLYM